jgi:NAD(P) transhydrogenase subunit alpha
MMITGIPMESFPDERRVSVIPYHVPALISAGLEVHVQKNAGGAAGFTDEAYREKGAKIITDRKKLFTAADIILQVRAAAANPESGLQDIKLMKKGALLIGFLNPYGSADMLKTLADSYITSFAMELIPRITRAQGMDALSSMASISGYKAALMAACALPRLYPMMMTAAGTITPARVLVIGAGVAGLQAIATAHRVGAVVHAYDVRPAVKEQVESLGAKFVELDLESETAQDKTGYAREMSREFYDKQRVLMARVVAESDVVISTASVPGKKAPLLITEEMVKSMRKGSVIVDLAAEQGGNCVLTEPGRTVQKYDVQIIGPVNLPATMPFHASQLYSKNVSSFLLPLIREKCLDLSCRDEIAAETILTQEGKVVNEKVKALSLK